VDERDQPLLDAFNDHQRRDGRAGPDASTLAGNALRGGGFTVRTQETPWQLTSSRDSPLVTQLLQERVHAAVAQDPDLVATAAGWLDLRRVQLGRGILQVELGHRDILALPRRL
jgi:hypothetical protein